MREPEGIETPPPGKSSERPWSKRREPDIRNVQLHEFGRDLSIEVYRTSHRRCSSHMTIHPAKDASGSLYLSSQLQASIVELRRRFMPWDSSLAG